MADPRPVSEPARAMAEPHTMPLPRPVLLDPPPAYAELRARCPVTKVRMPNGEEAWLLTRYDDIRAVLADPRFAVSRPGSESADNPSLAQDGAGHRRLRRLVSKVFTSAMTGYEPRVHEIADQLVRDMVATGPGADLVKHLSRPLPLAVISEILGVQVSNSETFQWWVEAANALVVPPDSAELIAAYAEAGKSLWECITGLVEDKRAHRSYDLLGTMIHGFAADEDRLSEAEVVVTVITLLTTGYLTTANALSAGVIELVTGHRIGDFADRPDAIERAVEEILRRQTGPGNEALPRWALSDVRLRGRHITTGDMVLCRMEAANHDPAHFVEPRQFAPAREPNPHLAFGHGRHHCLGAPLARIELRAALAALAEHCPELRLGCAPDEIEWTGHPLDDGPAYAPVTW
jgi:cytochrome P450